ncbi:MAG TPA: hypothetical protein VLI04_22230 [Nocardioidaceae bacterium]|nr:hypothetical protein [Nocardioidaceae bacterium]
MAECRCGAALAGRRRVCDACKAKPRKPAVPDSAADVAAEPELPPTAPVPAGLHPRGRALWDSLGQPQGTAAGELALEACRMADRLNELDRIIAGKGVLQLMKFRLDSVDWDETGEERIHVTVGFQAVLAEARHQQVALKDLLKEMRAAAAAAQITPADSGEQSSSGASPAEPSGLDQLAARRAGREQSTGN